MGICYGQTDVGLPDSFDEEARIIRNKLADIRAAACYSSPLQRCLRLATALGWREPHVDPRLMELHFGAWECLAWEEIPRQEMDYWGKNFVTVAPPGGESFAELEYRARTFLSELLIRHHDDCVAVVTHAGVIRALLAQALGMSLQEVFRIRLDYGGTTRLGYDGGKVSLGCLNF